KISLFLQGVRVRRGILSANLLDLFMFCSRFERYDDEAADCSCGSKNQSRLQSCSVEHAQQYGKSADDGRRRRRSDDG
ncbi:hypothetical protein ACFVAO_07570, partial [Streptomyces californicus]|uniref:hypothetical protein n=1 Tax=Streptomyces californicus TaxID=67351 RepID=UPI0036944564